VSPLPPTLAELVAGIRPVRLQPDDGLYWPGEMAALFRVSDVAAGRWADRGLLPAVRTPGGHRRFRAGPVNALLRGGPC
jgi:excisionase family DNA binding protein